MSQILQTLNLRLCSATVALLGIASFGQACMCVSAPGKPVAFGSQWNIVIWDAANHMEHFVRNAHFSTNAGDFGFIAPTPSKPTLSEASDKAFTTLEDLKPKVHEGAEPGAMAKSLGGASVTIVQEKDVAGYHATTLLASDSAALTAWLKANGYGTTAATQEWTKFYTDKGWYLTAFKVKNGDLDASTGTVRMSFKSDRPFNPYRVPVENFSTGTRYGLRLYFVSQGSYKAHVGATQPWMPALWSADLPADSASTLASQLKLSLADIPSNASVQTYDDVDFPVKASDDLYFVKDDASYVLPGVLSSLAVATMAGYWFLRRR